MEMYRVILVAEEDIPTVRQQGSLEVVWANEVEAMCKAYPTRAHWAGYALAGICPTTVSWGD